MDIISAISDLLYTDAMNLCGQDPTCIELSQLQCRLLDEIEAQAGQDLSEKLLAVTEELMDCERLHYFLSGLRLGAELLNF